jgi:hypothetical protein
MSRRYHIRRPTLEEARAKATALAQQGGPDGTLKPQDRAAFIEAWTDTFLDMDGEEFAATGPAPTAATPAPPTAKHPRQLTWPELMDAVRERPDLPQLTTPYDAAQQAAYARQVRAILAAEWDAINGVE